MGPHLGYELPDGVTKQFRPKKVEGLADQKVINVSCGESHTLGKGFSNQKWNNTFCSYTIIFIVFIIEFKLFTCVHDHINIR